MLKKEEWIVFAVFLLFAFLFVQFNHEGLASITGFVVGNYSEPSFSMVLEKDQLASGGQLKGFLNITFVGFFDPSTVLKIEFDSASSQIVLKDYFKSKNISFVETESSSSAYMPSGSKMFNFGGAGSNNFAFKMPRLASVKNLSMSVTGSPETPPSFVSFDVKDYTNKKEWKYFGDFVSFKPDFIYPSSLTLGLEGDPVTIGGQEGHNKTYFCEAISLPESKNFQLSAKLKKNADGADVKAVLLSFDGEQASGGADFCDLPEPGDVSEWRTCDLSFTPSTAKQGIYLVCVFYVGGTDKQYYELSRDSTVSDSRYDCPITGGSSLCFPSTSKDYFIGIKPSTYTGTLNKTVLWREGVTDQSIEYSLTEFLTTCKADEVGDCVISVTVSSESAGALQLGPLRIDYTEEGGASSYTDKFYDVSQVPGSIVKLDNVDLNNASKTLQISLSDLNITAPKITKAVESLYVSVQMVPGSRVSHPVKVYGEGYVPETGTVEEKVSNAKKAISEIVLNYGEELGLFGIELDTKQLESFESEINQIKADKNMSIEDVNSRLEALKGQVDAYLKDKPKSLSVEASFKDLYIPEPGDVEKVALEGEVESVYAYQSNVEVTVELSNYVLEKNNGEEEKYSIVKKTVTPEKSLSNVYVYEIIPKTLASSVANIAFKDKDYEVVQQDPIVRYTYDSLSQPVTIIYGVKDVAITQNLLLALNSIIVPEKIEEIVEKTNECGNEICEEPYEDKTICPADCGARKIPWLLMIILVIVLIAGVFYINFYKGKGAFRSVIRRSPFANPKDLENVKNYIKNAQSKSMKNPEIAGALLKSGWTKDQIIYAFEDLKWDGKRLSTIKLTPGSKENTKKLQNFIKKCLELNISKEKITAALLQKGWAVEKVDEAFAMIGEPQEKVETPKEKEKKMSYYFEKELAEEAKK